jgi:hypothetical protein
MKPTLKALVVVVAAFAIIGGIFGTSVPALAQTNSTDTATSGNSMDMGGGMTNNMTGTGGCITNNMTGTGGGIMQGPSGDAGETPGTLPPSECLDAGETPGTLPPSESLDAGETPMEGNMTTPAGNATNMTTPAGNATNMTTPAGNATTGGTEGNGILGGIF